MKRATLLLDDALYETAKRLCREEGRTLKEVINDLLRRGLQSFYKKTGPTDFEITVHCQNGPKVGADLSSREAMYDFFERHPQ